MNTTKFFIYLFLSKYFLDRNNGPNTYFIETVLLESHFFHMARGKSTFKKIPLPGVSEGAHDIK